MRPFAVRYFFLVSLLIANPSLIFAAEWQPIATDLLQREKPGYGGLCGVAVDRTSGHLYVDLSNRGVYRSADQGKTWEKHGEADIKGRTETPGCLLIDPTGESKRILMPLVYGSPVALGATDSPKWQTMQAKSEHVDWCAINWQGELKLVLALKHESGGLLLASRDGGATFDEVGKNYGPAWVFDGKTAVVARAKTNEHPQGGIARTTDGGKTFTAAGDRAPVCLPRWYGDKLYWLVEDAIIETDDRGATWKTTCSVKNGRYGPILGGDAKQIFLLTTQYIVESTDGGSTWSLHALPADFDGVNGLTWFDYDPQSKSLYLMKMSSDLYRLPLR